MRGMWRSTKEEIKEWLNNKEIDFAVDQNHNPRINAVLDTPTTLRGGGGG
jgi:hypothetical protein